MPMGAGFYGEDEDFESYVRILNEIEEVSGLIAQYTHGMLNNAIFPWATDGKPSMVDGILGAAFTLFTRKHPEGRASAEPLTDDLDTVGFEQFKADNPKLVSLITEAFDLFNPEFPPVLAETI